MEILNKSLSNKKRPTGRFFNFYCKAMVDGLLVSCMMLFNLQLIVDIYRKK